MDQWLRRARLTLKWSLVAIGLFVSLGAAVTEYRERRVGIGSGVVFAIVAGTMKAVLFGSSDSRRKSDAESL